MFAYVIQTSRIVCVIVLCSLGIGMVPQWAVAQPASTLPVLNAVVASAELPGTVTVSGSGFTPGGLVYVALYDQWGTSLRETRWVTASQPVVQPPQAVAPGESFSFDLGGSISEQFAVALSPIQVPDGNQNPATGPVSSQSTYIPGLGCGPDLMVRAHDLAAGMWTNVEDVALGC